MSQGVPELPDMRRKRAASVSIFNCHNCALISETTQKRGRAASYFNQSTGISGPIEYLKPCSRAQIEYVISAMSIMRNAH